MYRVNRNLFRSLSDHRDRLFSISQIKRRSIIAVRNNHSVASEILKPKFEVGDRLFGYRLDSINPVPELCLTASQWTFEKNNAKHLHIARDDPNNVFAVTFRTTPEDSTGVAHILEHLALCGSNRYPVRDPFMKMLSRSLATFMNAFTGCDFTMYPFSTQNIKDYYNLMSVYLDAVFHPCLRYLDFLQEGWRLEHSNIDDPSSPLILKGVVFNEMKGVFSSPSSIYTRHKINKLFPNTTYKNESGGDPLCIPELSYEQLKNFHAKHYHPSNAKFFTYGNFPIENHFEKIQKIIEKFDMDESLSLNSQVQDETIWIESRRAEISCQNDPLAPYPDRQTTVSTSWLLKSIKDVQENFNLSILCSLLCEGPNSPLYQALIDSGLGSDYSPDHGYHNMTKQSFFSIGLQGIPKENVSTVNKAIKMAILNAYTEGFPEERIEAILHRIELSTKLQNNNYGLSLLLYLNNYWNHDVDPIQCLSINQLVENFRKNLASDPKFLQNKVKQYFIDNKHKLLIEMNPDSQFEQKQIDSERKLLESKLSQLKPQDYKEIFDCGQKLLAAQDRQEDVSILPTLIIDDIDRLLVKTEIESSNLGHVPVQRCIQPTNNIVFFNALLKLDLNVFPKELLSYVPLFVRLMSKLGAGRYDRNSLDQKIQMFTGGLNSSVSIADNIKNMDDFEFGIHLNSFCLERNVDKMFDLWSEIFDRIHFREDSDHLMQLIRISAAELAQGIAQNGHLYAMRRSASFIKRSSRLREMTAGLSSMAFIRLIAASNEKIDEIISNLEKISKLILRKEALRCAINAENNAISSSIGSLEKFLHSLELNSDPSQKNNINATPNANPLGSNIASSNEHFIFPFSTNYIGQSVYCAQYSHPDHPRLNILSSLINMKYLLKEIREKGGAYGGGSKLDSGGVLHCYSYRDPKIQETIETFSKIGLWVENTENFSEADIDEAKLQVFQTLDHPVPPGEKGIDQFLTGISESDRQLYRDRLLDVTKSDVLEVAKRYLISAKSSGVVVLGPKCDFTANQKESEWKIRLVSDV
ncbi:Presequence protease [Sarcoptes scabiei]|uniref:Presequence protease, mitochondrial n=1 Tax=Sarcoptes scabiei TaxID=52283 RepID=A0A834R3Z5_SARSC|nr:Presequence protease [Sarcoptes scabiei]